jgi:SAM-dependent methyltransferase
LMAPAARSRAQELKDFLLFPLRAFTIFEGDKWGLSSLMTERYDYVAREVRGYCLDIGCGKRNRFINEFCGGNGKGIDVFKYPGLTDDQIVADMTKLPFPDGTFDSVAFIANLNHVPEPQRDAELAEAFRVLKSGGNIIVTMGNPLAEILIHQVLHLYDKLLGTDYDVDTTRGMHEDEDYYLTNSEIRGRLTKAGFTGLRTRYFPTQWGLNHLFVGEKKR